MHGLGGGNGRRGALPYAAIAVTVLVVTASWAVASYGIQRSNDSSDDVSERKTSVDSAEEHVSAWVERSLGEIVADVSSSDSGTMEERESAFQARTASWMRTAFPAVDSGLTVTVESWDVTLTSQMLQTGSTPSVTGYTPSYLMADGTVDVTMTGDEGRASRSLDVSADAGSALPLAAERGSLFANAVTGDGSVLSQLMTYQLSCLAQYRVINGWGALSYYGDTGTYGILTRADVKESYESCLSAISSLYLSNGDGGWTGDVDAASALIGGGKISVDLNSVYAQALYGVVDDLVVRWLDYFGGAKFLSDLDGVTDTLVNEWNALIGFLTGRDTDSAADYVRSVCGQDGYVIGAGESFTFTLDDVSVTVPYESRNVLETSAVKSFYSHYRASTNGIQDWITGIVNRAVASVAEQKSLGTLEFEIDRGDDFTESLTTKTLEAVDECMSAVNDTLVAALKSVDYTDRASEAIWHYIDDVKTTELNYDLDSFVAAHVESVNRTLAESGYDVTVDESDLKGNDTVLEAYRGWTAMVDEEMTALTPLCEVASRNSDVLREGCTFIVTQGLNLVDLGVDVKPSVIQMCGEFASEMAASGLSGVQEFPESTGFTLVSEESQSTIFLNMDMSSDPRIDVTVDRDSCTHGTSVTDQNVASYTTVWKVCVEDRLAFHVTSSDAASAVASVTTADFSGSSEVSTSLRVSAVSGWALTGVDYTATDTVLSDLEDAFLSVVLDMMEPLIELMRSIQDAVSILSEAASKLCGIAEDAVERLFSIMNSPAMKLQQKISEVLGSYGCQAFLDVLENMERSYNITLKSQVFTFTYGGWTLSTTLYLGTLESYTKHIMKTTLSGEVGGADFSVTMDLKIKGSSSYEPVVTGSFKCEGSDWSMDGTIDPTMTSHDYILCADGTVRGSEFTMMIPVLDQYSEVDLSLCDVPGLGTVLSNIPFVVPGTLVSLDAGLDVKYDVPVTAGVIINEVESNPEGDDKGEEWAEILNLSLSKADLSGWTITTSKNKVYTFPAGTELSVGERMVVNFEGLFLNNTSESLTMRDADGSVVEKISLKNDSLNDDRTCQRCVDGLKEWGLYSGTPGEKNKGGLFGTDGTVTVMCYEILKDAAKEALEDVGGKVTTEEGLAQLVHLTLKYALDEGIDELASCLVEASLYVEVEFTDVSSSVTLLGFRVHLTADKTIASDVLKYLVGNAAEMVFGINDPYNVDLGDALLDDTLLGVTFYTAYGMPSILDVSGDKDVLLGVDVAVNLNGICRAFGSDTGPAKVRAGVLARNIPYSALPSFMDADKYKTNDLWLFVLTFRPQKSGAST